MSDDPKAPTAVSFKNVSSSRTGREQEKHFMRVSPTVETTHFTSKSENFIKSGGHCCSAGSVVADDPHEAKVKWFFCDPELDREKDKGVDWCLPPPSLLLE